MRKSNKYKFSSKGQNKLTLEDRGEGPMSKNRKVLDKSVKVITTKLEFRTNQDTVATFEPTKKITPFFTRKKPRRRQKKYKTLPLLQNHSKILLDLENQNNSFIL